MHLSNPTTRPMITTTVDAAMSRQWVKKTTTYRVAKARHQSKAQIKPSKHSYSAFVNQVPIPAATVIPAYNSPLSFNSLAYRQREALAQYGVGGSRLTAHGAYEAREELQREWGLMVEETFEDFERRLGCDGCGVKFRSNAGEWDCRAGEEEKRLTEMESELEGMREEMDEIPAEKVDSEIIEMWGRRFQGIEASWRVSQCADCRAGEEVRSEWLSALGLDELGVLGEERDGVESRERDKRRNKAKVNVASAGAVADQHQRGVVINERVNAGEEMQWRRHNGTLEASVEGKSEEDIWAELKEAQLVERFVMGNYGEDIVRS